MLNKQGIQNRATKRMNPKLRTLSDNDASRQVGDQLSQVCHSGWEC